MESAFPPPGLFLWRGLGERRGGAAECLEWGRNNLSPCPPPDDTAQHILWLTWRWGRGLSNSISQKYRLSPNSILGQAWTQCWDGEEGPNSWSLHEELLEGECGKISKLQSGPMGAGGRRKKGPDLAWQGVAGKKWF